MFTNLANKLRPHFVGWGEPLKITATKKHVAFGKIHWEQWKVIFPFVPYFLLGMAKMDCEKHRAQMIEQQQT